MPQLDPTPFSGTTFSDLMEMVDRAFEKENLCHTSTLAHVAVSPLNVLTSTATNSQPSTATTAAVTSNHLKISASSQQSANIENRYPANQVHMASPPQRITASPLTDKYFTVCDWTDEWVDCRETATVHLLETEEDFCLRHALNRFEAYVVGSCLGAALVGLGISLMEHAL